MRKSDGCNDSLEKLNAIFNVCKETGVHCPCDGPFLYTLQENKNHRYKRLVIHPLLSWYHPAFADSKFENDKNLDELGTDYHSGWLDFRKIHWPPSMNYRTLNGFFLEKNIEYRGDFVQGSNDFIITISHFLPRGELVPQISRWMRPTFMYVVGCSKLDTHIRELESIIHVCGHTHIDHDTVISKIRYIQHAFGHPSERTQWWKSSSPYSPKNICVL